MPDFGCPPPGTNQSQIVSEAERQRLLEAFDTLVPLIPTRPQQEVDDELNEIRRARRSGGRRLYRP
jgi:hypothetical protein